MKIIHLLGGFMGSPEVAGMIYLDHVQHCTREADALYHALGGPVISIAIGGAHRGDDKYLHPDAPHATLENNR